MTILTGPMMSLEARGAIAQTLTFRQSRGRSTVGRYVRPPNPKSPGQKSIRAWNKLMANTWSTLSPANQALWSDLADRASIAPYHAFLSQNMTRWNQQRGMTQVPGGPETLGVAFYQVLGVYSQADRSLLMLSQFSSSNVWNCIYFWRPTAVGPVGRNDYIDIDTAYALPFWAARTPPLNPGTYHIWSWGYGFDGAKSNIRGPVSRVIL